MPGPRPAHIHSSSQLRLITSHTVDVWPAGWPAHAALTSLVKSSLLLESNLLVLTSLSLSCTIDVNFNRLYGINKLTIVSVVYILMIYTDS